MESCPAYVPGDGFLGGFREKSGGRPEIPRGAGADHFFPQAVRERSLKEPSHRRRAAVGRIALLRINEGPSRSLNFLRGRAGFPESGIFLQSGGAPIADRGPEEVVTPHQSREKRSGVSTSAFSWRYWIAPSSPLSCTKCCQILLPNSGMSFATGEYSIGRARPQLHGQTM